MKKRMSPAERSRQERVDKAIAEVRKRHPDATTIITSWSGTDLVLNVPGEDVGYRDTLTDTDLVEAAFSSPGGRQ